MSRSENSNSRHDRRAWPRPEMRTGRTLAAAAEHDIPENFDPWPLVTARLARASRQPVSGAWTPPALDLAARRRASATLAEAEEAAHAPGEDDLVLLDLPYRRRNWPHEMAKLVATALIFFLFGLLLALLLRDRDRHPIVGVPEPTPTPVVAPSPTITTAAQTQATATFAVVAPTIVAPPTPSPIPQPTLELLEASASISTGGLPIAVAAGADSVWVANAEDGSIVRIDATTNQVVATIPMGVLSCSREDLEGDFCSGNLALAVEGDVVWVGVHRSGGQVQDSLEQIDPATNMVVRTIALPGNPVVLALDGDTMWVATFGTGEVLRVDLTSGQVAQSWQVPGSSVSIVVFQGSVWFMAGDFLNVDCFIYRINPASNQIVASIRVSGFGGLVSLDDGLYLVDGAVYQVSPPGAEVSRVDTGTNTLGAPVRIGGGISGAAAGVGSLWLTTSSTVQTLRVDPQTLEVVARYDTGSRPGTPAFGAGAVWIADALEGLVYRIDP